MRWLRYVGGVVAIVVLAAALRVATVDDAGAAAPLLLLTVILVARFWGTGPALATATAGAGVYSYFLLPPNGFAIEDPDDWVALITFTGTAFVVGQLASLAERRAAEARAGQQEIERLFHELQNAFDRASEAEAARRNERLKAALLDAITHNLRTPLTGIKAAVTALIGAGPWNPDSELTSDGRLELLEVINEESDRLNRFIGGLSTADCPELTEPVHLRCVPFVDIARAGMARAENVMRDHRVSLEISEELPPVAVDAASITEALYILLDNASKYSPPQTRISVSASLDNNDGVRVAVADEGPGIPVDLREQVFDKFFRVPGREPYDPRRGGVGLGLSIARRLVEAQAGRIWVETPSSGQGTAVVMTLPVASGRSEVGLTAEATVF